MPANPRYKNGHRRRQLRTRLLNQGGTCPWPACPWPGEPFDPTLHPDDPRAPQVDEIIPISKGGDPLDPENCRLLHRWCNRQRSDGRRPPGLPPTPQTSLPWSTTW